MYRLLAAKVLGVRRAVDVQFDVEAPVVVLHGPTGAGKSSALAGMAFALSGTAQTERGRLKLEEIRHYDYNTVAEMLLEDDDGVSLLIMRTLTPSKHDLYVDDLKFSSVKKATAALEERLGVPTDQLAYLTSAHRLVDMDPLAQSELILGLLGVGATPEWLVEQARENADLLLAPNPGREAGWPLIQDALEAAENKRLLVGREAKALREEAGKAEAIARDACRDAKVPSPDQAEGKSAQVAERLVEIEQQLSGYRTALQAHQQRRAALAQAQQELARAEAAVVATRTAMKEAEAQRAEREAERAAVQKKRDEAAVAKARAWEEWQNQRTARDAAASVKDAMHKALDGLGDVETCSLCGQKITADRRKQIDETLADIDASYNAAVEAEAEAEAAFEAASKADRDAAIALDAVPPIPPAEALQARFDDAVAASDAANERIEALQSSPLPEAPTPQQVEVAEAKVIELREQFAAVNKAAEAGAKAKKLAQEANAKSVRYDRYNLLVERLRTVAREAARGAAEPLLELTKRLLPPNISLDYSPEEGLVARYGERLMPVAQLSTGERLLVGTAMQAAIALKLGIGVCLVDDASVLDPETGANHLERMVEIGREHEITWIVATAQPVTVCEGVQLINIDGGYAQD